MKLKKIVSGGQTGVDRAGLDFAIKHRIRHGGWCPRGRLAEDGRIPARYKLKETPRASYAQRTESNVRDSDATVIFSISPRLRGGTWFTLRFARKHRKPYLHLSLERDGAGAARKLFDFLNQHKVRVLNVAGPRLSQEPKAGRFAAETLKKAVLL